MSGSAPGECPDGGTCHHDCGDSCFRVRHCGPLSAAGYPGNRWPDEVVREHDPSPGPDLLREQDAARRFLASQSVTFGPDGWQDSRAETPPSPDAVTGATGVASVDTLRETATLTRLRDASRRLAVLQHEVDTEVRRAFAEGHVPADIDAAMGVRWPGVPQ